VKWIALCLLPFALSANPPKIVVFDFGGVIATSNYHPLATFMSKTMGTEKPPLKKGPSGKKLKEMFNHPPYYWEAYAGKSLGESWIENYRQKQQYLLDPLPGMKELIQSLQELRIQVALLSNTTHGRAAFLQSKGAYAPFNPVLLSCNLGVKKPEKKIYEILIRTLGVQPGQCIFIDNKKCNVEAAKAIGIDAIVFYSAEQLKQELLKRGIAL